MASVKYELIQLSFDDICKRKHKASKTSVDANPSKDVKKRMHIAILNVFENNEKYLANGLTSKELSIIFKTPLNCISGRLSELKEGGHIYATDVRRDGCAVLKLTNF